MDVGCPAFPLLHHEAGIVYVTVIFTVTDVNNITRVSTLAFPRLLFDRFSTVCVCFDAMDFFSFVSYLTESSMDSAWGLLRVLESETDMRSTHESSLAFLRSRPKIYKILSLENVYYTF